MGEALRWVDALGERITAVTWGALAHGLSVAHDTFSQDSAHRSRLRYAWRLAVEGMASLFIGAVSWLFTLSLLAGHEWVTDVTVGAGAHGSWFAGSVVSRGAVCSSTTWVRVAEIRFSKWSASVEGMTSVSTRAAANRLVVLNFAVCSSAASVNTGVSAAQFDTGEVVRTIVMRVALVVTPCMWVSLVELWACAGHSVVGNIAISVLTACSVSTRVHATIVSASPIAGAFSVCDTFSCAACEWISDVVVDA